MAAEGGALPGLGRHRRDQGRFLGRHRGWHRHLLRLRAARGAGSSPTRPSTSTDRWSGSRRAAASSAGTLCVPLEGVAVHINAFNFPCWGMLEKLAPTFLAGMPAIVKPATVTSYLTERMARSMVSAGILPEGALQIICGGVGDLLDHLTCQDVVTFTGSSATGRKLKSHPRVIAESVRFNLEADSLNYSILGPDAAPGTEEFDLFVKEVTKEMTVEGGAEVHRHPADHGAGGDDRGRGPGALEAARRRQAGRPVGGRRPDGAAGRPRTGGRGRRERGVDRRGVRAGLRRSGQLRGGGRRRGEGRLLPVAALLLRRAVRKDASRTTSRRSVR